MKTTHLSPTRCIYSSVSQETPAHKFPCVTVPRLQETSASEKTISQKYFVASSNSYTSSTHLVCIKVCQSLQTLKWGVEPLLYVYPYLNSCVKILINNHDFKFWVCFVLPNTYCLVLAGLGATWTLSSTEGTVLLLYISLPLGFCGPRLLQLGSIHETSSIQVFSQLGIINWVCPSFLSFLFIS